jgi:HEAT repeat protein
MKQLFIAAICGAMLAAAPLTSVAQDKVKSIARETEYLGKTLSQWTRDLRDNDPGVRHTAILAVMQFGSTGRQAASALINELNDRDPSLRAHAAYALGITGLEAEDGAAGLRGLARALSDSQAIVRYRAALTLAAYGPAAKDTIPQLITTLRDPLGSWEVRRAVVQALGTTGAPPPNSVPNPQAWRVLIDTLRDHCAQIRLEAIVSLIRIGKPTTPAEQSLLRQSLKAMFNDKDKTVAMWARVGMIRLDKSSEEYLRYIADFLKSQQTDLRIQAARALGSIGPDAEPCVEDLVAAFNDRDVQVVLNSIAACKMIGTAAVNAVPRLTDLAEDNNELVRMAARQTIETITKRPYQPKTPQAPRQSP